MPKINKDNERDQSIGGFIMNAFEIGIILGMLTLGYIVYEVVKYEPLNEKNK